MIGVLLVAHARIASEAKLAAEHILGGQAQFAALDITNSDASEAEKDRLAALLDTLNDGHGVLVLVDLYGATPWNITKACKKSDTRLLGGFNLPSVIRALTLRQEETSLEHLAAAAADAGKQYIRLDCEQS